MSTGGSDVNFWSGKSEVSGGQKRSGFPPQKIILRKKGHISRIILARANPKRAIGSSRRGAGISIFDLVKGNSLRPRGNQEKSPF